jgi:hypothetical protein
MADKTKFITTKTIVKADFANKIFGGLKGSDEAAFLDPSDPLVAGHIHDGENLDGHAGKVDLEDHVTGELDGDRLQDGTVTEDKLAFSVSEGGSSPVSFLGQDELFGIIPGGGFPVAGIKTFSFGPVSQDILLKRLVFTHISDMLLDLSIGMYISSITVGGGSNLLTGLIPMAMFTHDRGTRLTVPELNIPVPLGETVEVVVENLTSAGAAGFLAWTFCPNTNGETQSREILGMDSIAVLSAATRPTASITVNAVPPLTLPISIEFESIFSDDTITLTGVSGARSIGGNDFSVDGPGTTAAMASEIRDALIDSINDPINEGFVKDSGTTTVLGSTVSWFPDAGGTVAEFANTVSAIEAVPGELTVSNYSGATNAFDTVTLSSPTRDLELNNMFLSIVFGDENLDFQRTAIIDEIRINGVNILNGKINASFLGLEDQLIVPNLGEIVGPGDIIEVDIIHTIADVTPGALVGWAATIL